MQSKLFRTSAFQLVAAFSVILCVTLLTLSGAVYWTTARLIDGQIDQTIEAEVRGLAEQYRDEGLVRLVEVVRERSRSAEARGVYVLADPSFAPLAGNLEAWPDQAPEDGSWVEVSLRRRGEDPGRPLPVRGRTYRLIGGYWLFVGRVTEEQETFRANVLAALAWALLPALGLGVIGGVLVGRNTLKRIDAVSATGEEIVNGDLSRRMAMTGSGDEFDRLAQTINRMLDQVESLMTGMRAVTDSLAHDLRSPLTRAKSGIDMALRSPEDRAADRAVLERTNAELETILHTFDALINIAQAEAGVNRSPPAAVDLSDLLEDVAELYRPIAEDAGLTLEATITPGVTVAGHRQLLAQAAANLVDNAIKYTPPGGRIAVALDQRNGAIEFRVRDSGPGIPAAERERVLQRFVRLDDSRASPGSGLGLSLVAAVAKLHHAGLELGDAAPGLVVSLTFRTEG